ncbi:MAG TPA: hypothetical protein PLJ95_10225 [Candidatus Hydrogenedentes bacterium]|nr:hypothetical protein [Candidatus Hydrogenedentota bacterium]
MSLEALQEICLDYLSQSENPLVPLPHLYAHCIETTQGTCAVTPEELLSFLRKHNDVLVLENPAGQLAINEDQFLESGILMGTRAILKTRMPSEKELKDVFKLQLLEMQQQLERALSHATEQGDSDRAAEIQKKINQGQTLLKRFAALCECRNEDLRL